MNEQCPRCRSFNTISGEKKLTEDIKIGVVITICTLGLGLLIFIPVMGVTALQGHYSPAYGHCHNCGNEWRGRIMP